MVALKKKQVDPVIYDKDGQPIKFRKKESIKKSDLIFYIILIAFPLLHFCIFYIGVNFNSILLGFQRYDNSGDTIQYIWDVANIWTHAKDLFSNSYLFLNGIWFYLIGTVISTPLTLIFSFYIYKRCLGYNIFRVFLFLPSIISSVSLALIFQYFFDGAIGGEGGLMGKLFGCYLPTGVIKNESTQFFMMCLYSIFFGFGSGVLIYSDSMGSISPEVVESASLDGATGIREFFHITFPLIFGMWSIFFYSGIVGIFTGQYNLYTFYGESASPKVSTLGYHMFVMTDRGETNYPAMAGWGLWLSLITIPVTFLAKWLLEKFGPSTD